MHTFVQSAPRTLRQRSRSASAAFPLPPSPPTLPEPPRTNSDVGMLPAQRILRLKAVCAIVGLAKATIYASMARGEFPRQVPLTGRSGAVGWLLSDIERWLAQRAGNKND